MSAADLVDALLQAGQRLDHFGVLGLIPGITGFSSAPQEVDRARGLQGLVTLANGPMSAFEPDDWYHDEPVFYGNPTWWLGDQAKRPADPIGPSVAVLWRSFELLRLVLSDAQFEELWETGYTGEVIAGRRFVLELESGFLQPLDAVASDHEVSAMRVLSGDGSSGVGEWASQLTGICIGPDRDLPGFDPHVNRLLAARVDIDNYLAEAIPFALYTRRPVDWVDQEEPTRDARRDLRWFLEDVDALVARIGEPATFQVMDGLARIEVDGRLIVLGGDVIVEVDPVTSAVLTTALPDGGSERDRARSAHLALDTLGVGSLAGPRAGR